MIVAQRKYQWPMAFPHHRVGPYGVCYNGGWPPYGQAHYLRMGYPWPWY